MAKNTSKGSSSPKTDKGKGSGDGDLPEAQAASSEEAQDQGAEQAEEQAPKRPPTRFIDPPLSPGDPNARVPDTAASPPRGSGNVEFAGAGQGGEEAPTPAPGQKGLAGYRQTQGHAPAVPDAQATDFTSPSFPKNRTMATAVAPLPVAEPIGEEPKVTVRPRKNHSCVIGNQRYYLTKDRPVRVPKSVADVLANGEVIYPG